MLYDYQHTKAMMDRLHKKAEEIAGKKLSIEEGDSIIKAAIGTAYLNSVNSHSIVTQTAKVTEQDIENCLKDMIVCEKDLDDE